MWLASFFISTVYNELKTQHFERQKDVRKQLYRGITFQDVLSEINHFNIQYVMTKEIAKWYYEEIHTDLIALDPLITGDSLTTEDVESLYLNNINSDADFFPCHIAMIEKVLQL